MSDSFNTNSNTIEQAKEVIKDIQFCNGHVDPRDEAEISKTSAEYQQKTRRRAKKERETLARYTKTVSEQLYTSKFRFIYEMIQNADDASYSNALKAGQKPFLKFDIRPDALNVDSNQDAFEIANVEAICATGQSSKKNNPESIGEKGLGFKSVFGVSNQVHIQSGLWSFRFEHSKDDEGLGMVTPLWTDPNTLPDDVKTRFKLKYTEEDRNIREELIAEFAKLPETVIFFLAKVEKLWIVWDDLDDRKKKREKIFRKEGKLEDGKVSIVTEFDGCEEEHLYRVVTQKKPLAELPRDDKRQGKDMWDISLAFPVELENGNPIVSERGQHVFAYLPLQRLPQIPFLIQADFITLASRESLPECPWNLALRSCVANTFRQAIEVFCKEGGNLLYSWMQYLPTSQIEAFWEPLYSEIKILLARCEILRSMRGRSLRLPLELRVLPEDFVHDDEPLFEDLENDIYLSKAYAVADTEKLKDLGLKMMSWDEKLDRLEADLKRPCSRMRNNNLGLVWHTAVTRLVEEALLDDDAEFMLKKRLTGLDILPLQSGDWTSPSTVTTENRIYFPHLDGDPESLLIPQDIGLRTMDPMACVLPERKNVYMLLGITDCEPSLVTDRILNIYGPTFSGERMKTLSHFEILFWSERELTIAQRQNLRALAKDRRLRLSSRLFFRSEEDCHTEKLLQFSNIKDVPECGFIHDSYLISKVKGQFHNQKTWKGWLESVAGVRYYPHLNDRQNASALSPVLEAVLRDNPSQFVPTLQAHWTSSYKAVCTKFPDLKSKISTCQVLCQNEEMEELQKTFLPMKDLLRESRRFGVEAQMPILKLGADDNASDGKDWSFLQEFDVCSELSLTFYLKVLFALRNQAGSQECNDNTFIEVYRSTGRISNFQCKARLQHFFTTEQAIYVPRATRSWNGPGDCVWDGPSFLREKLLLKPHYGQHDEASSLFTNYLDIRNATYDHVLEELASLRKQNLQDSKRGISTPPKTEVLTEMYETLHMMVGSEETWSIVRDFFERKSLVFACGQWYKPSSCIWNCTINISGRVTVDSVYPNLQTFFVEHLQVKTANADMLVQELIALAKRDVKNTGELKSIMIAAGAMLGQKQNTDTLESSLQNLKKYKFLPVRSKTGGQSFEKTSASFFINDHERFGLAFEGKLNFLNFSYDELTSLHPLFQALKLENRYLSSHVETETTVGTSIESQVLANEFRQRSYYLSCCAISYQSRKFLNRNDEVHRMLMDTKILVSSDIWTNLVVRQGSTDVETRSDRALIKVEESHSRLKLYLPQNAASLQSCYRSQLPSQLMRILGIDCLGAEKQIYRLLTEETSQLQNVMVDEDIPNVSWLEAPHIPAKVEDNVRAAPATPLQLDTAVASFEAACEHIDSAVELPFSLKSEPSIAILEPTVHTAEYRRLLENVVRQAWRIPEVEQDLNPLSMTSVREALDEAPLPSDIRQILGMQGSQEMSFEAYAKIGAAGELFVFERLRAWGISNFDISNWQSTIRHFVKVLPEYNDLKRWGEKEVADIIYQDRTGEMEIFLREYSFNKFPEWSNSSSSGDEDEDCEDDSGNDDEESEEDNDEDSESDREEDDVEGLERSDNSESNDEEDYAEDLDRSSNSAGEEGEEGEEIQTDEDGGEFHEEEPIEYQFEVKTTIGGCDTTFFLSKNQYERMKHNTLKPDQRPRKVYVIFRVFNLLSEDIDMRIFVDPWGLKDETLKFVGDDWKVTPETGHV